MHHESINLKRFEIFTQKNMRFTKILGITTAS